jgi:3-deoxy-D-manno-octulosonic acid kinase
METQFEYRREPGGGVLLVADAAAAYRPAWFDGRGDGAADDAACPGADREAPPVPVGGRGSVRVFDTSAGTVVLRQYLRGGMARHVSRDRYLWIGAERTRGFRELRILAMLLDRGLDVPAPVAARYWRHGLAYRASLLMRWIPHTRTLAEVLRGGGDPLPVLTATMDAIARLHARGVWHADLNASNVLADADGRVWLIDFDRAQAGVADRARLAGNLDRLLRSLRKLLPGEALAAVEREWQALRRHYDARMAALSSGAS